MTQESLQSASRRTVLLGAAAATATLAASNAIASSDDHKHHHHPQNEIGVGNYLSYLAGEKETAFGCRPARN